MHTYMCMCVYVCVPGFIFKGSLLGLTPSTISFENGEYPFFSNCVGLIYVAI